MDPTFEMEQPSWVTNMFFGNKYSMSYSIIREADVPIFPDAREQGLIPCKDYFLHNNIDDDQALEYDELIKRQMQIFFLHENNAERDNDYPHK